jgi:hypothetical protein
MLVGSFGHACNINIKNMKWCPIFWLFMQYPHMGTKYASTMKKKKIMEIHERKKENNKEENEKKIIIIRKSIFKKEI